MKHKHHLKAKKGAWFVPLRGSYLPVSWQGWFLYVPFLLYIILVFLLVFQDSRPITSQLVILVPYLVSGLIVMTWVAKQKS
jgi:hypothetical protein